jgi:hypothetical protein
MTHPHTVGLDDGLLLVVVLPDRIAITVDVAWQSSDSTAQDDYMPR